MLDWPMLCPTMPPSVAVRKDADVVGATGCKLRVKLLVSDSFGLSTAGMHVFVKQECYPDKCACTTCHGLCDVLSNFFETLPSHCRLNCDWSTNSTIAKG